MPLSTPAKITIGAIVGAATVTGVGMHLAKMRRDAKKSEDAKKPKGVIQRDDGARPDDAERPVVDLDMDTLIQVTESEMGFPISVGSKNEIQLSENTIFEFTAGRRIVTVALGKVIAGEVREGKTWNLVTPSFELTHNDVTVAFDAEAVRLSFITDRAGIYFLSLTDQDGEEIGDGILFSAVSKAAAA